MEAETGSGPTRTGFATTDPQFARERLGELYSGHRIAVSTPLPGMRFEVETSSVGELHMDRAKLGLEGIGARDDPVDQVVVLNPTGGRVEVGVGQESARCGPGDAVLCPLDVSVDFWWSSAMEEVVVPLPVATVAQYAAGEAGIEPEELRFTGMTPVSGPMRRHWLATLNFLQTQLHTQDCPLAHPLVQAQACDLLCAALLTTFPNTTMTNSDHPGPDRVASAAVRRAMDYIEDNADRPLTAGEIATAAGVGTRGLQHAFASHAGVPPMSYVRRVRLERAHRELQAADPTEGETVKAIAARWGFASPARFAASYREVFGALPSDTLRG